MQILLQNLRYIWRQFLRSPGFALTAVLTISLGIGLTTVMYSVLDAVFLRPLSYPHPEQIVWLQETFPTPGGFGTGSVSAPNFLDWQRLNHVFSSLFAYSADTQALRQNDTTERMTVLYATSGLFPTLGTRLLLGRPFEPGEDQPGKNNLIVLTEPTWRLQFHSDPKILGEQAVLGGQIRTITGVLSSGFHMQGFDGTSIGAVVPLEITPDMLKYRGSHGLEVVGRLRRGISVTSAQAEMSVIASELERQYPAEQSKRGVLLAAPTAQMRKRYGPMFFALGGAVAFVLLIACANVAGLQLARAAGRNQEIAVRQALGASRTILFVQFLTESVSLSIVGGALGLVLASIGLRGLLSLPYLRLPRVDEISLNPSVMLFAFAASALTGVVFGLAPALLLSRAKSILGTGAGRRYVGPDASRSRIRSLLVILQVSLAFLLLGSVGLMSKLMWRLSAVDAGLSPDHVITMQIAIPEHGVERTATTTEIWQPVLDKLKSMPGTVSVGYISRLPLQSTGSNGNFYISGRPQPPIDQAPFAEMRTVGGDFYSALNVRLERGRFFNAQDYRSSDIPIIINDALAQRYFPNQDPLTQRIMIGPGKSASIIGVVRATRQGSLLEPPDPEIDYPLSQVPDYQGDTQMSLVVRTSHDRQISPKTIAVALYSINRDLAISHVETMEEVVSDSLGTQKLNLFLIGIFGGCAVLLALIGLYALLAYMVAQRTREIGVRLALGALRSEITRMILIQALKLVSFGLAIGLFLSLLTARLLQALLYGVVRPIDIPVWGAIALMVLLAGLVAAFVPAGRAASIEPMQALRMD
jgi:predicted permease